MNSNNGLKMKIKKKTKTVFAFFSGGGMYRTEIFKLSVTHGSTNTIPGMLARRKSTTYCEFLGKIMTLDNTKQQIKAT